MHHYVRSMLKKVWGFVLCWRTHCANFSNIFWSWCLFFAEFLLNLLSMKTSSNMSPMPLMTWPSAYAWRGQGILRQSIPLAGSLQNCILLRRQRPHEVRNRAARSEHHRSEQPSQRQGNCLPKCATLFSVNVGQWFKFHDVINHIDWQELSCQ